ncbi:MAG: thioredoxin fold domain-containing protein [Burkholderiaceae bacterium]
MGLAATITMVAVDVPAAPLKVELTTASDFHSDSVGSKSLPRLVVVLFSLPDCSYCDAIRREQLVPLSRDSKLMDRLVVREVSIVGSHPLVAFDKSRTIESEFAKNAAVRFSPTVAFFGPDGVQVVPAIVGARLPDFYGAYLDEAIEKSLSKLGRGS